MGLEEREEEEEAIVNKIYLPTYIHEIEIN